MRILTLDDLGTIRSAGFKAGPTGHAWYGKDYQGAVWRAYSDTVNDALLFSREVGNVWGSADVMTRETFDANFIT